MSTSLGSSQPPSRVDTPASVASSRASVATVETVVIVGDDDVGNLAVPLVDRSFLDDEWRPDEYACLATRGHKGKPLTALVADPGFGAEWSPQQRALYSKALRILNVSRIQRLASVADERQYLLTKLQIGKSAEKLRQLFAEVRWDGKLLQWLVIVLVDNLERQSLCIFMDLFRHLYQQIPALMDKCGLTTLNASDRFRHNNDVLQAITRPLYDTQITAPVSLEACPGGSHIQTSAAAGRPVFVLCPGDTPWANLSLTRRLEAMGSCVSLDPHLAKARTRKSSQFATLCRQVRAELPKVRKQHPGRHIVLVGHMTGARVAYEVARRDDISAVVCLGFPLRVSAHGIVSKLAECELRSTPALFVIGSNSLWSPLAEMERVRRQTPGSTLLVIPGADDALQAEYKFMRMGTTQDLCDHKAAAEIATFLQATLSKPAKDAGEKVDKGEKQKQPGKRKLVDGELKKAKAKGVKRKKISEVADGSEAAAARPAGSPADAPKPKRPKLVKKKAAEVRAVETEASGKAEGAAGAAALSTDPALHVDLRSPPKASD